MKIFIIYLINFELDYFVLWLLQENLIKTAKLVTMIVIVFGGETVPQGFREK